jgi:hypothetical protein
MSQLTPLGQALALGVLGAAAALLRYFLVAHFGQAAACTLWGGCTAPTVQEIRYRRCVPLTHIQRPTIRHAFRGLPPSTRKPLSPLPVQHPC